MKILAFDGTVMRMSFRAWVRSVELFFSTFGISDGNKVTMLSLPFKDSARKWWNGVQTKI